MRRLRRTYQKQRRLKSKPYSRFRSGALTAGTAAAIALAGQPKSETKALANGPDPHQAPVAQDADADLLADKEELAIGYKPFEADQNRNNTPDGVELARRCAEVINLLPRNGPQADPNDTYRICHEVDGVEQCDVCGQWIHMGGCTIINPRLPMRYPDPCDPLEQEFLPDLAVHYMEHGSFDCLGSIHSGRVDLPRLLRVLELRFPYEPNEHQLPLDYAVEPVGQLAPDANDADADLLADSEELAAGTNVFDPDQDDDLTPDGIELAKQCAGAIDVLPVCDPWSGEPEPNEPYKEPWLQRGLELCEICGQAVNMGYWVIVNPDLGLSMPVYDIACHYMSHGSFSWRGDVNPAGRIDVPLMVTILGIPARCGDLGTKHLPADLNRDCRVDLKDFAELAQKWLGCTKPH